LARARSARHDGHVFGRKKDEGGIPGMSSLSGGSSASSRPSGIPGSETTSRPAEPSSPTSSTGSGPQLGASTAEPWEIGPWTIRLFVVAFFAAFAVVFYGEEQRRLDDPTQKASRGEITASTGDSLIKAANLRRALKAVEQKSPAGATVESIRIEPSRLDVTVAQADGAQFELSVNPAFEVDKDEYPASQPEGLPFSQIPTDVPERLLGTIERKLALKPANLDYIVLNPGKTFEGKRDDNWSAFYSKPPLNNDAIAALNGTDVRLIGTPNAAARAQMRNAARDQLANLRRAERQIKQMTFPNEAMREQSLANIRQARQRAEQNLKETGQ
jgi:hypothetical protein